MTDHLSNSQIDLLLHYQIPYEDHLKLFRHFKNCPYCCTKLLSDFSFNISTKKEDYYYTDFNQPIDHRIIASQDRLIAIQFLSKNRITPNNITIRKTAPIKKVAAVLKHYFEENPINENLLPVLQFRHLSDFAARVYLLTYFIPFGRVLTYGELAILAGSKGAARAVGQILKRNPFPIIIPCHRVLGQNKALTGFAGGLEIKKKLLQLEQSL